ncbi:GTPase HflX [Candidatus Gottesmanbacteria bacterium RBG_16_37_8]|uniref:GTPase HflX n=1 Tax=Candidatus Gottesmanbacteria bacterium RBG_16_37_8 TaxID=1798371 RepID=A0A1F5YQ97_9BACT|nr:MAG: GTPase HflX [Candidatus Gottesmanbacteria bacterium RBG_16_37_8]
MLIGVFPKNFSNEDILSELEELDALVKTYGGQVFALSVQKAYSPSSATYLRSGKLQDTTDLIEKEKIDIVVVKDPLRSGQMYTLEKIFQQANPQIQVWDKIFLILRIFDLHAQTADAKLQIKIASLRHLGPRLFGMGYVLSRQTGGIGTRGIGETNTEIMKRHWRNEIYTMKMKIKNLETDRMQQIDRRRKIGLRTLSIVGYTNSGKTTLFNLLTKKNKQADNKLFVTLDSTSGKLFLPKLNETVLLTDTIGFIRNLPPVLIDSFKSTLMESINADLILHVIDISDKEMHYKIEVVEKILNEINVKNAAKILVFNKTDVDNSYDRKELINRYPDYPLIFISALKNEGISDLYKEIEKKVN